MPGRKKQNGNGFRRRNNRARRTPRFRGIVQGVGTSVPKPFGGSGCGPLFAYLDATHSAHLALPRATGPYTPIRVTKLWSSSHTFTEICPELFHGGEYESPPNHQAWSSIIARSGTDGNAAINGAGNCLIFNLPLGGLGTSATLVPAAVSLQLMNPEALQTTNGIVYVGRSSAQYKLCGDTRTWNTLGGEFVAYMAPRLCAAAKLAMRGLKVDSYPLNMSEAADFCPFIVASNSDNHQTWDTMGGTAATIGEPSAFAPIVVFNPNAINLQYLVTVEYRIRFDPSNPAAASHIVHKPASELTWSKVIENAVALGHGAVDIAETISKVGSMLPRSMQQLSLLG